MSDLLQQHQLPQSQLDKELKQNEQEQNAMWDSVALAALTEEDNDDQTTRNRAKDSEHNENDQGDNGIVLATSSDVGSVPSNSNDIQDMNNSSNSSKMDAFANLTDAEARELEVRQVREIQYLQQRCHEGGRLLAATREENATLHRQIKESDEYATKAAEMVQTSFTRLAEAMEANEAVRKENEVLRVKDDEWRQRDRDLKARIDVLNKKLNEVRKSADLQKLHRKEEDESAKLERARKQEAGFAAIARAESARLERERVAKERQQVAGFAAVDYAARSAQFGQPSTQVGSAVNAAYGGGQQAHSQPHMSYQSQQPQQHNRTSGMHHNQHQAQFQNHHSQQPQPPPNAVRAAGLMSTPSGMVYNQRAAHHQAQAQLQMSTHTNGSMMSVNTAASGSGSQLRTGYNPYAGYNAASPQRSPTGIEGNSGQSPYSPSHGSVGSSNNSNNNASSGNSNVVGDSYSSTMRTGHNTIFNNPYRAALLAANGITPDKLPPPLSPDDQWKADVELLQKIIVEGVHVGTSDPGTMKAHVGNMLRQLNPLRFPDRAVVKQFLAKALREGIVLESGEGGTKALHLPSDFAGVTNRYPTIAQASEAFAILSGQDRSSFANRTGKKIVHEEAPERRYMGKMMTDKEREENDAYLDQFRKKKKNQTSVTSDEMAGAGFASISALNSYGGPMAPSNGTTNNNSFSGSGLLAGFGGAGGESSFAGFASIHSQPLSSSPAGAAVTLTASNSSDNGGADYGFSRLSVT